MTATFNCSISNYIIVMCKVWKIAT